MPTNLVSLCSKFEVGTFYNGINGTSLLAESTVDALGHVNIIPAKSEVWGTEKGMRDRESGEEEEENSPGCPTASILSFLCLYCDCLCWAYLMKKPFFHEIYYYIHNSKNKWQQSNAGYEYPNANDSLTYSSKDTIHNVSWAILKTIGKLTCWLESLTAENKQIGEHRKKQILEFILPWTIKKNLQTYEITHL